MPVKNRARAKGLSKVGSQLRYHKSVRTETETIRGECTS